MITAPTPFALSETYVHLRNDERADPVPVTPDFWPTIDQNASLQSGRLVTSFEMTGHSHWERHPAGEEFIFLASGRIDVVVETAAGDKAGELHPGEAILMPPGMWHRFVVHDPGCVVIATAGRGSETRPL